MNLVQIGSELAIKNVAFLERCFDAQNIRAFSDILSRSQQAASVAFDMFKANIKV
jgi:hypothetical protein